LYADARGFSQILDQDFKKSAFICEICVPFAPMSGSEEKDFPTNKKAAHALHERPCYDTIEPPHTVIV
jgi:hypothetical protein